MPRNLNTFKMKKVLLSALAVFAFGVANAQEEGGFGFSKGDVIVEGNISVTSKTVPAGGGSTKNTTSYAFRPSAGYFIADKFAVGLGLNIASDKSSGQEENTFGVSVAGRYYFLDLGQRFKVYGQATVGFDSNNNKDTDAKSTDIGFGAGLGVNYFLTRSLAINFGLTDVLSIENKKPKGADGTTTVNFKVNEFSNFFTTPTFGLTFKF